MQKEQLLHEGVDWCLCSKFFWREVIQRLQLRQTRLYVEVAKTTNVTSYTVTHIIQYLH